MKLYEAMFVVDSNKARQEHEKVVEELKGVILKGGGEVVNCDKWEERKLCYAIKRHKRAIYYLAHFRAEGEAIVRIERAAQLCETVLRALITVDEDGEAFPVYIEPIEDMPFGRPRRFDGDGDRPRRFEGDEPRQDRGQAAEGF